MEDRELTKWLLTELSCYDDGDIESNDFDVYGEDAHGCEGAFSAKINQTAGNAYGLIAALETENKALTDEVARLGDAEAQLSDAKKLLRRVLNFEGRLLGNALPDQIRQLLNSKGPVDKD